MTPLGPKKSPWNQFEVIKTEKQAKWAPSKSVQCKQAKLWLLEAPELGAPVGLFGAPMGPQKVFAPPAENRTDAYAKLCYHVICCQEIPQSATKTKTGSYCWAINAF